MTVVLDAWAVIALFDDEPRAAPRIEAVLEEGRGAICSVNLGEVLYRQARMAGMQVARDGVEALRREVEVVEPDWPLVSAAAAVKARGGLSYADAFCIATAMRLEAPLWTGDPEILGLDAGVETVDLR